MHTSELVITGPDSIVASLPFIVGFTPTDSLVVMWLDTGCVRLTMRLDLPPDGASHEPWIDAVMAHQRAHDEVIICVVPAARQVERDESGRLRGQSLVASLLKILRDTECGVRDALLVVDNHWWSYLCQEPECCPAAGTEVDPATADAVAARFALAGVARLPDRDAVLALCAANPERQAEMLPLVRHARITEAADPALHLDDWRDEAIDLVREALLTPRPTDPHRDAEVLAWLCDTRVRDTVLWEVAHSVDHDPHRAFDRAAGLLRCAPAGVIAPIGTVTALLAWLNGDGVRAVAALDRVHEEDPEYALAQLLGRSITAGLSPRDWREMMSGLSREACRGARALPVS
ncbi:MAG: DUF4192 domain-containing protein [Actinomycetes bacterium]